MNPYTFAALVLGGISMTMGIPIAKKLSGSSSHFLSNLGFFAGPRGTPLAWGLALVLAIGYIAFSVQIPVVAQHSAEISWLKGISVVAAIVAGIVEEAFFRRFLMDAVAKKGGSVWMQVVVSGCLFGLAHGSWGLLGGGLRIGLSAAIPTTVLGLGLGGIYTLGKRSLAPCIVAHSLIDLVLEPGLLLVAVTGFGA